MSRCSITLRSTSRTSQDVACSCADRKRSATPVGHTELSHLLYIIVVRVPCRSQVARIRAIRVVECLQHF
jgi:hypothetical protein